MKRLVIIGAAVVLFASTAAIASADDADVDTETTETRELNDTQLQKAEWLADYVVGEEADEEETEAALEEIVALRDGSSSVGHAVGWGAMFKLLQLAEATDMTLAELLAEIEGDDGWAFGRRFKELDPEQSALLEGKPKNLGQLKKQAKDPKTNQGKKP